MVDAALPISDLLAIEINKANPRLPMIKIPAITDIGYIDSIKPKEENYFLYCGGAIYIEIVEFCIKAFEKIEDDKIFLYLVVSGNNENIKKIENRINNSTKAKLIKRFSYLSYSELISYYKGAKALLIPLRDNVQDTSRFPHKVAEYSASGSPIISSSVGEVSKYFKNKESAYLAKSYSVEEYTKLMNLRLSSKDSEAIAANAKNICNDNFDFIANGKQISEFIKEL
jgi:glycosyltransferase involved in cell wall biosynthesis